MGEGTAMCTSPFAFLGRTVATKQTRKRNAAGRFEGPVEGVKLSGGAKRVMRKKVKDAWPDITDKLVETAKKGDFRATKWLWDECGLGKEMPQKKRGSKSGFAQTLIDEFKRQQATTRHEAATTQKTGPTKGPTK